MTYVVSFENFRPSPRNDGLPWTKVQIEESAGSDGPWAVIDIIDLVPVDDDPTNPQLRSFTTEAAALPDGWYRISFLDATDDAELLAPIHRGAGTAVDWAPTVEDVAAELPGRAKDGAGAYLSTFTDATEPTRAQVLELIDEAVNDVALRVGYDMPTPQLARGARVAATRRAAMLVELRFFRAEVAAGRSIYQTLKELYDDDMPWLEGAVGEVAGGGEPGPSDDVLMPSGVFPPAAGFGVDPW